MADTKGVFVSFLILNACELKRSSLRWTGCALHTQLTDTSFALFFQNILAFVVFYVDFHVYKLLINN